MKLGLDEHGHLDSLLHQWEPKYKLVGLMGLILAFSFIQDPRLLPAMLAVTLALYALSRMPLSFLIARLRYPGFFLLIVAILLPFLSGSTVLLRIGPLAVRQEGCLDLLLVVSKFVSILTLSLILFGTAPFLDVIKAMRSLGLPFVLADMTLLTYRYIYEIGDDLERMETAMGLRGFHARYLGGRVLRVLASLAGSVLVRSYERSERVYKAMVLRGYGQPTRPSEEPRSRFRHLAWLFAFLLLAAGFIAAEIILRQGQG